MTVSTDKRLLCSVISALGCDPDSTDFSDPLGTDLHGSEVASYFAG
jgi:hypothetical protein